MISGPTDLAELAIRVTYDDVGRATVALDGMTTAGVRTEEQSRRTGAGFRTAGGHITDATRRMTLLQMEALRMNDAMGRATASSVAATHNMGAWAALNAEATGRVGEHSLSIGRLGYRLESMTTETLAANRAVGLLGATFLKFGIGDIYTIAILGGIYAVVKAYDFLTTGSREARKEADKMTESLLAQARAAEAATIKGAANLKLIADMNLQTVKGESGEGWRTVLERTLLGSGARFSLNPTDAENQATRLANTRTASEQAGVNEGKIRQEEADKAKRKTEEAERKREAALRKAEEEALRYRELMNRTFGGSAPNEMNRTQRADWLSAERSRTMSDRERRTVWEQMGLGNTDQFGNIAAQKVELPHIALTDGLTKEQVRVREKMGIFIEDANKNAEKLRDTMWQAAMSSANTIVSALNIGGGGRGSGIGGALGQSAGSAAGAIYGPAGMEIGGTLGNIFGSLLGGLFDRGKAEREAAKAQKTIALELDRIAAQLAHNQLATILLGIDAQLQSQIAGFNAALPGKRNEELRNADIATAQALADQQKAQATKLYEQQQQYGKEDLAVRNMRALGMSDQGNLLAFREQQARERDKAILEGRDQTYLNTLATVQNNELIAYQNGLLSDALRNAPRGFFASRYYSEFTTPRDRPVDPFGTGVLPPNHPTDPTVSHGAARLPHKTTDAPPRIDVPITLMLDGKVLTTVVVKHIDQAAAATGGAGSSRAHALELMR